MTVVKGWVKRAGLRTLAALPLGVGPARVRGWVLYARTRRATEHLRRDPDRVARGVDGLIAAARARRLAGDDAGHRAAVERLVDIRPGNAGRLDLVVRELVRLADPDLVARYEHTLDGTSTAAFAELRSTIRLVELRESQDEDGAAAEIASIRGTQRRWPVVLARALARTGDWDLLAEHLRSDLSDAELPAPDELARLADTAFRAGRHRASALLADLCLRAAPGTAKAQETKIRSENRIALTETGWPWAEPAARRYDPAPGSVLAVLSQSLPIRSGGYATRSHGVLTGLAARGWDVAAMTRLGFPYDTWARTDTRTVAPVDVVDGIEYHRAIDPNRRTYPHAPLEDYVERLADHVEAQARARRAGLIHASSFYATGLGAAVAARRLGIPFVYEMRGLEDLMHVSRDLRYADSEGYRFLSAMEVEVCRAADEVLVITAALAEEMARRGVPAERMTVMPNGVHPDRFTPVDRDAELEAELSLTGKTVIGYAGGLIHYEGLELLVEAAGLLAGRRDDVAVVIVGDGPSRHSVAATVERLGLGDHVRMTGRVPHSEITRYLSLFDITPFPRLPLPVCELISPIKPFEAMATGKAVIVSDVAALTEIVRDGQTGLVFAKGDAQALATVLERLLDSPELRAELGGRAREWAATDGSWEHAVARVDAVYGAVHPNPGGRADA